MSTTFCTASKRSSATSSRFQNQYSLCFAAHFAIQLLFYLSLSLPRPAFAQKDSSQFTQLQQTLENHGFTVTLAIPPQPGSYGALEATTRTIWINPVVFDLEIAIPTLVHEAVHAAQLCNGSAGNLTPLNLGLSPYARAYRLYMRYTGIRRTLEMEAYTIQARPDRIEYVTNVLNSRC